jgi:hypothetical protein
MKFLRKKPKVAGNDTVKKFYGRVIQSPAFFLSTFGKQFSFTDQGEFALKGFEQPLRMYEVHWQEA